MFLGEYQHTLDSKGRLTIPSKYRDQLATGMVLARHPQGECLLAMPNAEWEKVAARVSELPMAKPDSALLRRLLFSSAEEVNPDKQGRILVSQRLREIAQIQDDVIIAGLNTYLELWSPPAWEKNMALLNETAVVGEMFSALGI